MRHAAPEALEILLMAEIPKSMTYEDVKSNYMANFDKAFNLCTADAQPYVENLPDLEEAFPEWVAKIEEEM